MQNESKAGVEKGMTLRDTREAAGLTQRDLARLARVCRASVSHIETGRYAPSARFAGKICRALSSHLGCSVHTWQLFPQQFHELRVENGELAGLLDAQPDPPAPAKSVTASRVSRQCEVRA
jgi:DNA-binding XRE family transcriptional regulator